jgi:Isoprenylcysteine carboxyl methyltransferase (ICMT) family
MITIGATIACLGLAVLGWGGFAAFFSHPPLIALAITVFVLSGAALFSGGNLSPGEREDRADRWVIIAFAVIGLLSAYLPAYTDRKEFWTVDGESIRWLGVVSFAAGGALRIWPVFVLGRRFSGLVAIQPGHTLVTTGIYRIIRHPSYVRLLGVRACRSSARYERARHRRAPWPRAPGTLRGRLMGGDAEAYPHR